MRKVRLKDAKIIESEMIQLECEPNSAFKAYVLKHFTVSRV